MKEKPMRFGDLPIYAKFRFYPGSPDSKYQGTYEKISARKFSDGLTFIDKCAASATVLKVETVAPEHATQEQVENYKGWLARRNAAARRMISGQYDYTAPQDEEEGISLAAIDDEIAQLSHEYKLTGDEVHALECEMQEPGRKDRGAEVQTRMASDSIRILA